jgi:transposase
MQLEILEAPVRDYILGLQANYEYQIKEKNKKIIDLLEYQNKYLEIKERYDLLVYKRFMRGAEQIPADEKQAPLFTDEKKPVETPEEAKPEELTEVTSHQRKKPGRKPLDPNLPRVERIIDIPEDEKTCICGTKLTKIGEETSEKLHIIPPKIYVEKIIRPKYACRCCEGTESEGITQTVRIAQAEPSLIPRGIATPSLLSCIFTQKFEDHLPYYRQEKQFERIGASISRQDMGNWQQQVYQKLMPLFKLLKENVKSGPVI